MDMIDLSKFDSFFPLSDYLNPDERYKKVLCEQRWGDTVACPVCGSVHIYARKGYRFSCTDCNHTFSATSGTIFENTKSALRKWFIAMYLISSHKKGISSVLLATDINVTQKTAWFMLHKIRHLYGQTTEALAGRVEMGKGWLSLS